MRYPQRTFWITSIVAVAAALLNSGIAEAQVCPVTGAPLGGGAVVGAIGGANAGRVNIGGNTPGAGAVNPGRAGGGAASSSGLSIGQMLRML